ncbi:MAG: hypothetical protein H5T69_05060 [Chloroflexi bacterium]|nr:hypothetical protein [Chloroflexota bacterium]
MISASYYKESLDGWWHTWFDEGACWRDELPPSPSIPPTQLPPHEPTVGWAHIEEGMESLRIPGTWEAARPGYHGVAWHWRPLVVPAEWERRRVYLRFEGIRLQAEVYLDRQLVGYDLEGATPFEVDITPYVEPERRHELALRVTHPGGWRSAREVHSIEWAGRRLPAGPDVGGVWGKVTLVARPAQYLEALTVLPGRETCSLVAVCEIANKGERAPVTLTARVIDDQGATLDTASTELTLAPQERKRVELALSALPLPCWTPETPALCAIQVRLSGPTGVDEARLATGFRPLTLSRQGLLLDGQRYLLLGALTAGHYPLERLLPRGSCAEDDVRAARTLGLNTLVAWHQPLHPDLLAAADRRGLLLVQTLGLGPLIDDDPFYADLARQRVERLVRRDAAHPSIVAWHLGDLAEPAGHLDNGSAILAELLALLRALDPSRPILWNAGEGRLLALDAHTERRIDIALGDERLWPAAHGGGFASRSAKILRPRAPASLPDLPALERYGAGRGLPGSDIALWQSWSRALEADFATYGLERVFGDLSAFCRATWPTTETVGRLMKSVEGDNAFALWVDNWSGATTVDLGALVDPLRRPKVQCERVVSRFPSSEEVDRVKLDTCLNPNEILARIRVLDPLGYLQAWTSQHLDKRLESLPSGAPGLAVGLAALRDMPAPWPPRVVLLLDEDEPVQVTSIVGAWLRTPLVSLPLNGAPAYWLCHLDRAPLSGVAPSGVWAGEWALARARYALRAAEGLPLPFDPLVVACALSGEDPTAAPRLGTVLALAKTQGSELLLCTLDLSGAGGPGGEIAERLLGMFVAWLAGHG